MSVRITFFRFIEFDVPASSLAAGHGRRSPVSAAGIVQATATPTSSRVLLVSVSDWFEFSRGANRGRAGLPAAGPLCLAEARGHRDPTVSRRRRRRPAGHRGRRRAGAPLVILVHGFPDLAYCWRDQIPALADAGYHVLAHDQRGYGGSSQPDAVEAYDITALTGDVVALIDDVGAERAAVVGHDGGGGGLEPAVAAPRSGGGGGRAERAADPRPLVPPTQAFRNIFGDNFFYMLYFQQPGVADAELARDPHRTMRLILGGMRPPADETDALPMLAPGPAGFLDRMTEPERLPEWLTPRCSTTTSREYRRTGFTGALNWYRNLDRNWHILAHPSAAKITVPGLFIGGAADPVLSFTRVDRAREVTVGPYHEVLLDGAGHWIQQERPEAINSELLTFLSTVEWT